jgi:NAD(P)-dependent dehydrogenase (short-subunit alcohol dehydrogenase family)
MQNKVVVITGASRGIGADTARVFAKSGAKVALLARSTDEIDALASEIGSAALAIQCDVADYGQVKAAVDKTVAAFGRLDVMISNAGMIQPISRIASSDPAEWANAVNVNLTGTYNCTRAALPGMIAQGGGTILNISSGAAHSPIEGWTAYCSSKAGAAMLTRGTDHEVRENGIRVMGLSPGTVATQMQRDIKASGINPVSQMDWSDHVDPDWPARALLWMCSPDADEFLGQEISLRDEDIRKRAGLTG